MRGFGLIASHGAHGQQVIVAHLAKLLPWMLSQAEAAMTVKDVRRC